MDRVIKRLISVTLTLLMIVSILPAQAIAPEMSEVTKPQETLASAGEEATNDVMSDESAMSDSIAVLMSSTETYGNLNYQVNRDNTITIVGCAQDVTSIEVPSEIEGIPVTSIGMSAFLHCSGLTSVTIPESVTSIESQAFWGCSSLTSVIIPESVTSIGYSAFRSCVGLTSVIIPKGVTSIGHYAFSGCSSLTNLTIPESVTSIGELAFNSCIGLTSVTIPKSVTSMGGGAFSGCSGLTSVTISLGVTFIGDSAFSGCSGLTSVTIPESVISIRNSAFSGCNGLTSVMIPKSVSSIGKNAFAGCSLLTNVTIPESISTIEDSAFQNCSGLTSVTIPKNVTSINFQAFSGCSGLTSVTIPESVTSIGYGAFWGCSSLTSVTIPESVTSIGRYAFCGCSGLTSVTIPNSVTSIAESAFYGCSGLVSVTIPESVTSIDGSAFYRCKSLKNVIIPKSVTSIGGYVFYGCSNLTSAIIPQSVTSILTAAFGNCENLTLYVIPDSYAEEYAKECKIPYQYILNDGNLLTLTVADSAGSAVTTGYVVRWYEQGGAVPVAEGNTIWANAEINYEYEVVLDDDAMFRYRSPARIAVADSSVGTVTCVLEAIPSLIITGRVTDMNGAAISNASVIIRQSVGDKTRSQSVSSNADGNFSANALKLNTIVSVEAQGYYDKQHGFSPANTTADGGATETVDIGTFQLTLVPENRFMLTLTLQKAAEDGETPLESPLETIGGLSFAVRNVTRNREITGDLFQYPYLVIGKQAEAGDKIRVTISDANGGITATPVEAVYEGAPNQPLEIHFIQNGQIAATFSGNTNKRIMLFDSTGTFLRQYGVDGGAFISDSLTAGEYQLVFMEKSSLLNSVPSLSRLAELGLVESSDYLLSTVTVTDGKIANLGLLSVPTLNPDRLSYMDADCTSVTANKANVSAGQIVTVRAQYRVKDRYLTSNQRLVVELPENCNPLNGGVSVNGKSVAYSLKGRTLTVQTGVAEGTVLLMLSPEREGDYSVSCFLAFDESGENVLQPLGTAFFKAAPIQINVPSATSKSTITVSGVTMGGASVTIYDEDRQIGSAIANAAGRWLTEIELSDRYLYGVHYLYAVSETSYGAHSLSDTAKVIYDANHVDATSVTIIQNWSSVVIDMNHHSSKTLSYSYNPSHPSFTFLVKFTKDDAEGLSNVYVVTKNASGEETRIPCSYQERVGWTGAHSFGIKNLPVSISVEYTYDSVPSMYGEETIEALKEDLLEMEQLPFQNLGDALSVGEVTQIDDSHISANILLKSDEGETDFCTYEREFLDISAFQPDEWNKKGCVEREYEDGTRDYTLLTLENDTPVLLCANPSQGIVWKDRITFAIENASLQSFDSSFASWKDWKSYAKTLLKSIPGYGTAATWTDYGVQLYGDSKILYIEQKNYQSMLEDKLDGINKLIEAKCKHGISYRLSNDKRISYREQADNLRSKIDAYKTAVIATFVLMKACNAVATLGTDKLSKIGEGQPYALNYMMNLDINLHDELFRSTLSLFPNTTALSFQESYFQLLYDELNSLWDNIISSFEDCNHNDDDYLPPQQPIWPPFSRSGGVIVWPIIDPSGYVCEAVPSNRLEGVATTIYYQDSESNESVLWDAAEYNQENPLITDIAGRYSWDVPIGQWQVKYEKPGYETAYSDWLPVPPPQTEINISLVSTSAPHLNVATVYEKEIRLEFSQYMKPDTVNAERVLVTADGVAVSGIVQPVNLEASFEDSSVSYASVYRFIPETSLEGQIQISVNAAVENYAGVALKEPATVTAFVERKPLTLSAPNNVEISMGTSQVVDVKVLPDGSGFNRKIVVASNIPGVISAEDGITDDSGVAHIPVMCLLPGSGELRFTLEGTELTTVMTVNRESIVETEDIRPVTYTLTVTDGIGGGAYEQDAEVTIKANTSESGKQFKEWIGADSLMFIRGDMNTAEATFVMPAKSLTVTAFYEDIPSIETVSVIGQEVQANIRCSDSYAMIFCAIYDNSGKMIAVRSAQITGESNYQFQFDGQQFDYAKAFIVDSDFRPLCESKRTN